MTASELNNFANALVALETPIANFGDKRNLANGISNSSDRAASVKFGLPALMSEPIDENGVAVPREDLNQIFFILSKMVHYLMAGGKIPYSAAEATAIGGYPKGAEVKYNGHNYRSIAESNTAIPTDTSKWLCVDYLPLLGDTMLGQIQSNIDDIIRRNTDASKLKIAGGATDNCASISLHGGSSSNSGQFDIIARSTNLNERHLTGNPVDGSLKWNGENIVRSINGIYADANGNVKTNTRTLIFNSSGLSTGTIALTQPWTDFKYLIVIGSNDSRARFGSYIVDVDTMYDVIFKKNTTYTLYSTANEYWIIYGASRGTTNNQLICETENCYIHKIYGINSI